jgi:hypothetical protein
MKIRNGFVSNSSSSSFVVLFPREPKNATDVKGMLFREDQKFYYSPYGKATWKVEDVAKTVWEDICSQQKNDIARAKEYLTSGSIEDIEAPDFRQYLDNWKLYHEEMDRFAQKKLKEFFPIRKLKLQKLNNEPVEEGVLYCFSYSDNDGEYGSALEHGNLFERLKHIVISNH